MFGLFVNLTGRLAVVVGGGSVGQRKARALLDAGARVRVVCLEPQPAEMADAIEWLSQPYQIAHLTEASLVIAAAVPAVNAQVVADARAKGIWVNDAASPDRGDFVTPALVRRGEVAIAITTGVPALTRALRERLTECIEPEYASWAALLAELRPRILTLPAEQQAALWRELTDVAWLTRLREVGAEAVRAEMTRRASDGSR